MKKLIKYLDYFGIITMLYFLTREYHKLYYTENRYLNATKGSFRVVYQNNIKSSKMCYKLAKRYQTIFGGRIVDDFKFNLNDK